VKSFKNHLSLVIALLGILFSLQIFTIVERSIDAYKKNLATDYALVVVSQKRLDTKSLIASNPLIASVEELSPDAVIKRLNSGISKKNIELLKITLPKFYKLKLKHYPTPKELEALSKKLLKTASIEKVESFTKTHDITYKLLLLFKTVVSLFAFTVVLVTVLLIFKELRIWQFQHHERMSIMALFGAPVWLRSAVLFRLAIVDAIVAFLLAFVIFSYLASLEWVQKQFDTIGIAIRFFDPLYDSFIMLGVALLISILLAVFIVLGHKEEV
jgi:cell division transport system permease protein